MTFRSKGLATGHRLLLPAKPFPDRKLALSFLFIIKCRLHGSEGRYCIDSIGRIDYIIFRDIFWDRFYFEYAITAHMADGWALSSYCHYDCR